MAKKNFGKFLALATITGAVAAGVSYFLKYRSFHAELDEDFHDFEGDDSFDGTLPHEEKTTARNYVPLGEKKEESTIEKDDTEADGDTTKAEDPVIQAADATAENSESSEKAPEAAGNSTTTIEDDLYIK